MCAALGDAPSLVSNKQRVIVLVEHLLASIFALIPQMGNPCTSCRSNGRCTSRSFASTIFAVYVVCDQTKVYIGVGATHHCVCQLWAHRQPCGQVPAQHAHPGAGSPQSSRQRRPCRPDPGPSDADCSRSATVLIHELSTGLVDEVYGSLVSRVSNISTRTCSRA
jgi:hypothetical protein